MDSLRSNVVQHKADIKWARAIVVENKYASIPRPSLFKQSFTLNAGNYPPHPQQSVLAGNCRNAHRLLSKGIFDGRA